MPEESCPFCLASRKEQKSLIRLASIGEPNRRFKGSKNVSELTDRELYCSAIAGIRILADIVTGGEDLDSFDNSDFVLGYEKARQSVVEMAERAKSKEATMPTVGKGKSKKKFPYSKAGKKAAAKHAKKTGTSVSKKKKGY